MSKYHSSKTRCNALHVHDSKKEARRCNELHLLLKKGYITKLEIQRKFELLPTGRYDSMPSERKVTYIANFAYMENGKLIVEDTKGYRTKEYILKRKIFKDKYCRSGDIIFRET